MFRQISSSSISSPIRQTIRSFIMDSSIQSKLIPSALAHKKHYPTALLSKAGPGHKRTSRRKARSRKEEQENESAAVAGVYCNQTKASTTLSVSPPKLLPSPNSHNHPRCFAATRIIKHHSSFISRQRMSWAHKSIICVSLLGTFRICPTSSSALHLPLPENQRGLIRTAQHGIDGMEKGAEFHPQANDPITSLLLLCSCSSFIPHL